MTAEMRSDNYERASELAQQSRYEEALELINQHLLSNPDDVEALNDAGVILHCLCRSNEAIEILERAKDLKSGNGQVVWNLAEAYLADAKPEKVIEILPEVKDYNLLSSDIINRTANAFLEKGENSKAFETLLYSLEFDPNQKAILEPMLDVIKTKRPKVSFFCGFASDVKFLTDIYKFTDMRFTTQFYQGQSLQDMHNLMKESDICWFEWCTDMAVKASRLPKVSKNIIRLHRCEAYTGWPKKVNWENIDYLVLIGNSYIKKTLLKDIPDLESLTKVITIPNGINTERFYFSQKQKNKNIATVGYINTRKNPMMLIQCMQKLHYIDPEYKLYFGGNFESDMIEQYLRYMVKSLDLEDVVIFDNWQSDVRGWLEDKSYIVSASIGESQGLGVLEAMSAGLKPVIHNFPGAEEIFAPEFLFNIAEQFCDQILCDDYDPQKYRSFVEQRYPLHKQLKSINEVFTDLEKDINFSRSMGLSKHIGSLTAPLMNNNMRENTCV